MSGDHIPVSLQRRVRERAGNRCEYCRIAQIGQEATFHVDHVRPRRDGGPTVLQNLALACVSCSLRKGTRTHATDPLTEEIVEVYSPREHRWDDHFEITAAFLIVGKTALGRGAVDLLKLNRPLAVAIRQEEALRDRYP